MIASSEDALLLTVSEVARRLAISVRLVERLVAGGELRSVRIGRARRIPCAAVAAYVDRLLAEQAAGDVELVAPEALHLLRPPKTRTAGRGSTPAGGAKEVADGFVGKLPVPG